MNPADIIGIIIVLALIIWGAKKGFVQSVFSLGSFIIALVLAMILSPLVSGYLEKSFIGDYVKESAYEMLVKEDATEATAEEIVSALPLPKSLTVSIADEATQTVQNAQVQIADSIADAILRILSLVIVFILVKLLVFFIARILDLVSRLPVLRTANKLLGGMLGAVYGVLIIYILLTLLTFGATVKPLQIPLETVLSSRIVSVMYHNNIILNYIQ